MELIPRIQRNRVSTRTPALLGLLLLLTLSISPVYAQSGVITEHAYTFSQAATFTLTFPPETAPAAATLYLKIGTFTQAYPTPVVQDIAQQERNLGTEPLPPFTTIIYWWEYRNAKGKHKSNGETALLYEDQSLRLADAAR